MNRPSPVRRAASTIALFGWIVAACGGATGSLVPGTQAPTASETATPRATLAGTRNPAFPTAAFTAISPDAIASAMAARLRDALVIMAESGGMTATLMSPSGTWSGAAGKADGVHDLEVASQFGIASITKSVIAAQVMQMVEAGELSLDRPATDYLPAGFTFDTNGATLRQLLSHRSGIPDWYGDAMEKVMAADRGRIWTIDEVLAQVPKVRSAAGELFGYADTNYTLLGLVIEHVRKRPLVEVLRGGVLDVAGTERLVYQPDEAPSDPMAMPRGEPRSAFELGGGYLPSMSDASSAGPAGSIASDSISLARWWRAFCAGELVSQASLTEMSTMIGGREGYGLGLFDITESGTSVGHAGASFGYVSWAGCMPEDGLVVTVLANFAVDDIGGMARPLIQAARR